MSDEAALSRRRAEAQERVEKAKTRLDQSRAALAAVTARESNAARKKRTRGLIAAGGLLVVAGLADGDTGELKVDPSALLGALLRLAKAFETLPLEDATMTQFKTVGDAALASRERTRKKPGKGG